MTGQPQRVLFLLPSLEGGGAQRVFSILLRHLDRIRFEPHLALLQAHGPYLSDIPPDVPIHELKASRARYALLRILKLVRALKPQTVLSTLGHVNLALTIGRPFLPDGTRLFIREAAIPSDALPDLTRHPAFWRASYRLFYRRADRIVCLSEAMVEDMAVNLKLPRHKLVRIYNPVDVENVRKLAGSGVNPYSGEGPHILAAGRLSREKGFDLLLAAMPAVLKQFPRADLTILGEGAMDRDLAAQARSLDIAAAVRLPGFLENPWPYFKHASVFVLPSRYEGLPNVVLEALALRTPVIATDCTGGIQEIRAVGADLLVVPPENPQALGDAIIAVCRAEAAGAPRADSSSALSKFSVSEIVSEYSKLLLS